MRTTIYLATACGLAVIQGCDESWVGEVCLNGKRFVVRGDWYFPDARLSTTSVYPSHSNPTVRTSANDGGKTIYRIACPDAQGSHAK
jgi:hypothetical protein